MMAFFGGEWSLIVTLNPGREFHNLAHAHLCLW